VSTRQEQIELLAKRIVALKHDIGRLQRLEPRSPYRGTKTTDFTTGDLPQPGDYGYQTTDLEVQMNCNGAVRAIDSDDELKLIWLGW